ncbi:MAG: DsrE/DsrF/DrsH-like family protein [Chloroflexota bacterium]
MSDPPATISARVDARGMQRPGPILAVYKQVQEMEAGQVVEVLASDPGFRRDVGAWSERTGHALLDVSQDDGTIRALVRKAQAAPTQAVERSAATNNKTVVVFSADLDRALASFIIANGAAAMGQRVTMFFTFWGLNILRRATVEQPVRKNLIEHMFGWMMPKGADALKLSKLNMGGMGTWMMKMVTKSKNIDSLPALMRTAQENGVRLIACQMAMDMMGLKPEELVDGVEIGGVATYINETDKASATLFI